MSISQNLSLYTKINEQINLISMQIGSHSISDNTYTKELFINPFMNNYQ